MYRSGSTVIARILDSKLHETLREMADLPEYKRKIIMGDFNLNRIVWNPEPSVPDGVGFLLIVSRIHIYINILPSLLDSWRDSGQHVMTFY